MVVREARPDDADAVLPLAAALASSFTVDTDAFHRSFSASLDDANAIVLVAEESSSLVGYLLGYDHFAFFANGRVAGVEEVYVAPERRGQGIGKALMQAFEEWARARSAAQIIVCTRRAADFYTAIGYEETALCFRRVLRSQSQRGK